MSDVKPIRQKIMDQSMAGALEKRSHGVMGYVVHYHTQTEKCYCDRHAQKGQQEGMGDAYPIPPEVRHTADIRVYQGTSPQIYYEVPCMVYSQGIIDKGLKPNDRVFVQFLNGDPNLPVITAYYREPSQLDLFWNNLHFAVADFFHDLIFKE